MSRTRFKGPVYSDNGFVGSVTLPNSVTAQTLESVTTLVVGTTSTLTGAVNALAGITGDLVGNVTGTLSGSTVNTTTTHPSPAAINATATATGAQAATGYITTTSAAPTTILMPTGTDLGTVLGAVKGTIFDLYFDNIAGSNTLTIGVNTGAVLSAAAVASAGSFGLLTVASGATGQACFRLMFSSSTAYTFSRIA